MESIKLFYQRHKKLVISIILVIAILSVALYSCAHNSNDKIAKDNNIEESLPEREPEPLLPDSIEAQLVDDIDSGTVKDIYSMVCSAVEYKLADAGFECEQGIASTIENDNYNAFGMYYYKDDLNLFTSEDIKSVGFLEVVRDLDPFKEPSAEQSIIVVDSLTDDDMSSDLVCTFNYNDIGSSHFVFEDKYVIYYQQTPMRVVYSIQDNNVDNYDLSIGSLYDYDNNIFLYDETIFDDYINHSAVELFSDKDYDELEKSLQEMSKQQLNAGYTVTKYDVIYISPEQVQAYLDSKEEDTFFGYSVADLTESLGIGTALEYKNGDLVQANVTGGDLDEYDWKGFLTKIGVGCGVLIVGAVLAPITGGSSMACALVSIVKITVTTALCSALGNMAIETAKGMMDGKTFSEALHGCTYAGLDAFAQTFMITAGMCAVGVNTGLIKPGTCFVSGTEIAVLDESAQHAHKPIEEIQAGDRVLSYSEKYKRSTYQPVIDLFKTKVNTIVTLSIDGDIIQTTREHPFYNPVNQNWVCAEEMEIGDYVLLSNGTQAVIENIRVDYLTKWVDVYNFTVEGNHTYYVGKDEILVHNKCTTISSMRQKAVRDAWKEEVEAVRNGTSKYDWTPEQIQELLETGKVSGYDGHHIIPVSELKDTAAEYLISSSENIVLIKKEIHMLVHAGGNVNGNMEVLVQCVPWVEEKLIYLLELVG